ncbi:unnamed protein product [Acanthosepion pharaonis]|uniref:Uncharacterized protein n=1 Tax=Acanthosepion pharaonis TaxID=158019 RepID=A0A812D6J2_ACAPH|nr:unnamed protein product [Sepia pharaonis]
MYTNIEKERKNNKKSSDFLGKLKSISPGSLKNRLYPVYPNHHKKFAKILLSESNTDGTLVYLPYLKKVIYYTKKERVSTTLL